MTRLPGSAGLVTPAKAVGVEPGPASGTPTYAGASSRLLQKRSSTDRMRRRSD
jgi:hypothetical protein